MAQKIYDVTVKVRSYTDRDGKEKGVWQNVGSIWKGDDGGVWLSLARWFNPAGVANPEHRAEVTLSLFKPKSGASEE